MVVLKAVEWQAGATNVWEVRTIAKSILHLSTRRRLVREGVRWQQPKFRPKRRGKSMNGEAVTDVVRWLKSHEATMHYDMVVFSRGILREIGGGGGNHDNLS